MASVSADRLRKQSGWRLPPSVGGWAGAARRLAAGQWVAGIAAGAFLGLSTLAVFLLPSPWGPLALAAALLPFVAMVVGDARKLFLGIVLLDIPFPLQIHLDYHRQAAALGAFGGLQLSATTISLMALYVLWIAELLTNKKGEPRPRLGANLPLALYVGFAALSVLVARDVTLARFEVALLVQTFLLYVYIVSTVRTRQDVLFVATMLMAGLALEGLVIVGSQFFGLDFAFASLSTRADPSLLSGVEVTRVSGTVGSPILAASYLALLLAPALGILLTKLGAAHKALAVVALGFGGLALILTFSRGGWITFGLSTSILCLLAWRRGWLSPVVPLAIAAAAVVLGIAFQDAITVRVFDSVTAQDRIPLLELASRIIRDHPWLGVGANNYAINMLQYLTPEFDGAWLYTVHDKYLLVWAETGLGGLLAFVGFLLVTLHRGWQGWKLNDRFLSPLALGFAAAILGQMVHMLVDVFHSRPQIQMLWVAAALIMAMSRMGSEVEDAQ